MLTLRLDTEENEQINDLLGQLTALYECPCDDTFLLRVDTYAARLPDRILLFVNEFRQLDHHNGTFLLKGFHIDDKSLEQTPFVTGKEIDEASAAREGFMLMLLISLLGDPFGWSSQRSGALINNVLPLKTHEGEQLSTGSAVDLDWHTEEAFHPYRADYLALMCLRNPDQVPTVLGSVRDIVIGGQSKGTLFQPRFLFHPDKNFQREGFDLTAPCPVLFGDFNDPYIRIDPSFMEAVAGDRPASAALSEIIGKIKQSLYEMVLEQGDVLFIDNFRVVHGRKAFRPRFDGTDRWLKRVNITSDLRKSRAFRNGHSSRIIITN
jgi:alpha-ketoglutarate-dependent taurine dioxygenase